MLNFQAAPFTLILLLLNVLVSVYALFGDRSLMDKLAFKPRRVLANKEYYRLITGGFVHVAIWHLAFNMLTLFFFGPYLEMLLGSASFLIVYFGAELAAHGLTLVLHKDNPSYAAVGASGAISGIIFAYCLFNPFSKIGLFFAIWIPAWVFAIGYVGFSIYAMKQRAPGMTGGIAHEAHLGGALGGLLLTILVEPRAIQVFLAQLGF